MDVKVWRRAVSWAGPLLSLASALALISVLCIPSAALAYFSKPAVGVYLGASSISLVSGSSNTVSVSVDMWSESQLPGCGMAECPQGCGNIATPDGVVGGCLSADGWCTCAGSSYVTAYTQLSASSSNPSVARASISGGAMTISAYSPGSATITVYSSLSKHADGATSMTVNVPEEASSNVPADSSGSSASASDSGSASSSGSGSSSGAVSVSAVGTSATAAAAAATAASASGDEQKVVEIETEDGKKVIVVKATDAATAATELGKIAGTEGTCTFWSGGTLGEPSISWTFKGTDLSASSNLSFDPNVSVSKKGTGDVAKLLAETKNAIVMDFEHSGALPATAEVYVRASGVYADGVKLNLYSYDEDSRSFTLEKEGVEVVSGYAVYSIDHCSVWALSDEDLAACAMPEDELDASSVDVHAQDGMPVVVGAIVAAVVLAAVVAFVVVRRRKVDVAGADIPVLASNKADEEPKERADASYK